MKSEIKRKETVTLVLDAEEAEWLHAIMQNPLWGQSIEAEDPKDAEMRLNFFNSTGTSK